MDSAQHEKAAVISGIDDRVEASREHRDAVAEGLAALGVENFVLVLHDASFPSDPRDDVGRGSPYSRGARAFLELARDLGFNGVQLGPQGETSRINPSPYDGSLFSRSVLSIDAASLVEGGLVGRASLDRVVSEKPLGADDRVAYAYVYDAQRALLREALETFRARMNVRERDAATGLLAARLEAFSAANAYWLEKDGLFEALAALHGTDDVRAWPDLDQSLWDPGEGEGARCEARMNDVAERHADVIDAYELFQFFAQSQHDELRAATARLGLKLFGDLQVGISARDAWSHRSLFLEGYLMGAPPSRTNPDGQPWSYPVLDPAQYVGAGPRSAVLRFMRIRLSKLLSDFDGLRIDHPHGIVCPWVYSKDVADPLAAVQAGARLFDSPDLPDHPALARFAIARREQLDRAPGAKRYADDWVRELDDVQVAAYSTLFDVVVEFARANGRAIGDIVSEVLSTQPLPLARVMERYGLGRFRVTQKASLVDSADVYRVENAKPNDWVMVGNHDTAPLWRLVREWSPTALAAQARYLASRLVDEDRAGAFAEDLSRDPNRVAEAKLAEMFTGAARNVTVFFPDLFGLTEIYNSPGVVRDDNWTLRVRPSYRADYASKLARGAALNVPRALAMALRAPARRGPRASEALLSRLDALAAKLTRV